MIMAKGFMSPCNLQSLLSPLPHFKIPPKTHFYFLSNSSSFFKERDGFCAFALKKKKNAKENNSVVEIKDFDDELDFNEIDDFQNEDGDENDDDEDEGFVLPLENMRKWLENRPPGFGKGKAYDTSIEDKLFDEIEQSKEAQLININKLKSNPIPVNSKVKQQKLQKALEDIPSGICVRLSTLPKKKNIHKNLKVAFKEIPGILKISPAVSGNEKTRDPVCKGFAYIYLRSEQDANRFIEVFSKQSINFGKIEKLIKCEIVNPPRSDNDDSTVRNPITPKTRLPRVEEVSVPANTYKPTSSLNTSVETVSEESDGFDYSENSDELDHGRVDADWEEESSENWESLNTRETTNYETVKPKSNSVIDSSSSTSEKIKKNRLLEKKLLDKKKGGKEESKESIESVYTPKPKSSSATNSSSSSSENTKKIRSPEKKKADKKKGGKVAMVSALGSAKGLKMKEKALLTGVLSKYAENASRKG